MSIEYAINIAENAIITNPNLTLACLVVMVILAVFFAARV